MIDWEKRFPMFGLTRQHLKNAGLQEDYIQLLDDKDMQSIATHAGSFLLADGSFADAITFAAWNCILGTKLESNAHESHSIEDGPDKGASEKQ